MSRIEQITNELKCAFDGEAWHGRALMEILDGVNAKAALARPVPAGHNIWELVLHVTGWERVITRRLHGEKLVLSDAENFGHITETTEAVWRQALSNLQSTHAALIEAVASLSEDNLNARVPGKPYDVEFMLHGAAQHAAYHGGQISLLKRAHS